MLSRKRAMTRTCYLRLCSGSGEHLFVALLPPELVVVLHTARLVGFRLLSRA